MCTRALNQGVFRGVQLVQAGAMEDLFRRFDGSLWEADIGSRPPRLTGAGHHAPKSNEAPGTAPA